jgi:glycosyltransferase involved in cell wall biosynthesis
MSQPKISIVMSVYNGERYLREAIEGILNQTFGDFEFLIVNDASNDDSPGIMRGYGDARIKILDNEENIGLTRSLNKAIEVARGEYIARQDADDVSLPKRLEEQLRYLKQNPEVAVLGTSIYIIDENGKISGRRDVAEGPSQNLFRGSWFAHGSVMFRRDVIRAAGGYNELFRYCQDYELWLRLARDHPIRGLPQVLYKLRYHTGNVQFTMKDEAASYHLLALRMAESEPDEAALQAVREGGIKSLYPHLNKNEKVFYHKAVAHAQAWSKNMKRAREEYKKALRLKPFDFKTRLNLLLAYLGKRAWSAVHRFYERLGYV